MAGEGSTEPKKAEDPAQDAPSKPDGGSLLPKSQVRPLNPLGAEKLRERRRALQLEREESDLTLSKWVGWGTLSLMGAQVVAVDAGFFWYAAENNWKVPAGVMVAWLGVGIVQVIGSVVLVVARHLFPGREKHADPSDDPKPS